MKAQAVVAESVGNVRFRDIDLPPATCRDITVRVLYSWISNGTETSFIRGERSAGDTPWLPGDPLPFPLVPGYQSVGEIIDLGSQVVGYSVGQRVFSSIGRVKGMHFDFGGHMSRLVIDSSQVWPIPETVDPKPFAGAVLTQVGYNAGMRAPVEPGESAIVIGDGLVGHWAAQTLRMRGAQVTMIGRHPDRLAAFKGQTVMDPSKLHAIEVGVVIHTAGPMATVESLYPQLRRGGHIVSAGFVGTKGAVDVQRMRDRELSLHAISGWTRERVSRTLTAIAEGQLDTLSLVTHEFRAEDAASAYRLILDRERPYLGVILDWRGV